MWIIWLGVKVSKYLTLKVLSKIVADDIQIFFQYNFQRK